MIAFFHGLIGSAHHWDAVRTELPPGLRINCFAPEINYTAGGLDAVAASLRQELRSRRPDRLVLCGNSIGCVLALRMADLADDLVLAAPPFDSQPMPVTLERSRLGEWLDSLVHPAANIPNRAYHHAIALRKTQELLRNRVGLRHIRRLRAECAAYSEDPRLTQYQNKITHVIGADDHSTPSNAFGAFHTSRTPAARLHIVPDAAHTLPLEAPRTLARLLTEVHGSVSPLTQPPRPLSYAS